MVDNKEKTLENLLKAYNGLMELVKTKPEIKEKFNMQFYGCYDNSEKGFPVCETSGCLLGNMARVFDLNKSEYYRPFRTFNYRKFAEEEFPALFTKQNVRNPLWHYLFSTAWGNSFDDAIDRLKLVIDYKLDVPKEILSITYGGE